MAHKELKYDAEARRALEDGRRRRRQRGQGHARPQGPLRRDRQEVRRTRPSPTTASRSLVRSRSRTPFENQGAQLVREVATATNDVAGDGTTTATVLAQRIVRDGLKNVAAGANPLALKRGIEKAVDQVVESIQQALDRDLRQGADRPRGGHLRRPTTRSAT